MSGIQNMTDAPGTTTPHTTQPHHLLFPDLIFGKNGQVIGATTPHVIPEKHETGFAGFLQRHPTADHLWENLKSAPEQINTMLLNSPYGPEVDAVEMGAIALGTLAIKSGVLAKVGVFAGKVGGGVVGRIGKSFSNSPLLKKAIEKYPKQYQQFSSMTKDQLQKSISSLEKQIEKHEKFLNLPSSHVKNWDNLTEHHQTNLIHHWNQDIERQKSYIEIAKHIIENNLNEAPKNGI